MKSFLSLALAAGTFCLGVWARHSADPWVEQAEQFHQQYQTASTFMPWNWGK